jgi:GWxTD domain-containing protein
MNPIDAWMQTSIVKALGWTLLHSLWEGAIIALALAAALYAIRSPRARHAAACLALAGMLAGFGLTLGRLMLQQPIGDSAAATIGGLEATSNGLVEQWRTVKSQTERRAADLLPWLAPFWMAGVVIFHLRSVACWMAARRLRRTGVCCAPDFWQQRLNQLGARLRLSRPVALLESCLADVPVVLGYASPVILMPVGLLAGLPAGQIESILLHELAHIRRYDYLVNLLQTFVEGFLFYHPAVWWISGVIRAERENCCDDLVVATTGDAHEYAVALAALEQNRWSAREAALAATGGNLVKRIRRLLYQPEGPRAALTPVAAGILTIATAVGLVAWQAAPAGNSLAPSSPFSKWINEDVAYIANDQERATFNSLQTDKERENFIEQFWLRRDPTPGTPENEFKEEHYRRIAYANERYFVRGKTPGWKTDRGRIYITYGPPNEIEDHSAGGSYIRPDGSETTTYPFQQWRYRYIQGVGNNIIMEFVDITGLGDYRMTTDPHAKEGTPVARPGQNGQLLRAPTIRYKDLAAAVDSGVKSNILPMQVHADYLPVSVSSVRTDVTIQIANKDLQFQRGEGKQKAVVNLYGRITSLSRRVATNVFEDNITVESPEALFSDMIKKSSLYQKSIPLAPGEYRLNLAVRDVGSGKTNTYEMALNVPKP